MPQDGQIGTAPDGSIVMWSQAAGRAIPVNQAQALTKAQAAMQPGGQFKPSSADEKGLSDLQTEYNQAHQLSTAANQFMKLQGSGQNGVATGLGYRVPIVGDVVRGVAALANPGQASRLQQMDAINAKSWPLLRPGGSGPIRIIEASGWKNAFPSAGNTGNANQGLTDQYNADDAEKLRRLNFISDYVGSGKGHYGQAEAAYAASRGQQPKQQAAPQQQAAPRQQAAPQQQAPADPYHPPGWTQQLPAKQQAALKVYAGSKAPPGDRKNPYVPQNPGQFQKLPAGSWVLDDDGTVFQKR